MEGKRVDLLATGRVASLEGSAALIAGGVRSSAIDKWFGGEGAVGLTFDLQISSRFAKQPLTGTSLLIGKAGKQEQDFLQAYNFSKSADRCMHLY